MIRVAQMMTCNTLIRHIQSQLSDKIQIEHNIKSTELMKIVLPLFLDDYKGHEAPFSIQNIVEIGKTMFNKKPGEWYGVHSISQVIKSVNDTFNSQYYKSFKIVTFNEGVVYKEELNSIYECK